jgi:hypothetical protein
MICDAVMGRATNPTQSDVFIALLRRHNLRT